MHACGGCVGYRSHDLLSTPLRHPNGRFWVVG
jgi:hypothetical protein